MLKWIRRSLKKFFKPKKKAKRKKRRLKSKTSNRKPIKRVIRKIKVPRKAKGKSTPKKKAVKLTRTAKKKAVPAPQQKPVLVSPSAYPRRNYYQTRNLPISTGTPPVEAASAGIRIGAISHYFQKICVVVMTVENNLKMGESIEIRRKESVVGKETVKSMQINRIPIDEARKGEEIGIKLKTSVQVGDEIFRV